MSSSVIEGGVTVSDGDAALADYVRLLTMFCRSRGISRFQGPVVRAIAPLISAIFFLLALLQRRRPRLIAVRHGSRIVAGMLLSQYGTFETIVIDAAHSSRMKCIDALATQVDVILAEDPKRAFAYWTLRPSLVRAGAVRGFHPTDRVQYVLTADLGPLRCSWLSSQPRRRKRLACVPLYHMERGGS